MPALCNYWSDKSSLFFIASIKIADASFRSTLLNVSKCLDLFFRFVFLSQAKHFSYFIISFDLRRIPVSEGSSCCSSTMISIEISSFSFVYCFNILFNFMSFVKPRRHWSWHFTVSFSNNSAVMVLHLSRMRWKSWKLDGPFSTAVHFLAYSLRVKHTDVLVDTFSLLLKCCSHN